MGAGNCPKETEVQLLKEALQLNLGFSESLIFRAIKHLVKEFGSCEDTPAWIRQDNFTVLVNYLLDNVDMESPHPRSESVPVRTEQVKRSRSQQRDQGGKPSPLLKKVTNGLSGGSPVDDSCGGNVDQQKDSSQPQKGRLDRQALRLHYREKLFPNSARNKESSASYEVNWDQNSTAQRAQMNSGSSIDQSITNKNARSLLDQAEHLSLMVAKVEPVQRLNAQPAKEDQLTTKKRGQGLIGFASSDQKKGKISDPEGKSVWKTRTLMPSGCHDLATAHGSSKVVSADSRCSNPTENRRPTGMSPTHDWMLQANAVTEQTSESKALSNRNCGAAERPLVIFDPDRPDGILSTSSKINRKGTASMLKEAETCKTEMLSSNDGQKASCSALDKSEAEEKRQDCVPHDAESRFLEQLEGCLKEGNCQHALKILKAWKIKGREVGTRQIKDGHPEGEGQDMVLDVPGRKKGVVVSYDISRGLEKLPISCVNEYNMHVLPDNFLYVTRSVIRQAAHVDLSLSRIGDLHCCCSDDCLRSSEACKCSDSTRGEYAYDENGRLIQRLAINFVSGCTTINGDFITECCDKCPCSMKCGNRIVQRGITKKLQVFMTRKKGWGVRALEKIPAHTFVFEYLGEIATNSEQYERNLEYAENGVYTYVMYLDGDHDMERKHFKEGLKDNEALVLDATIFGNVSRFVNHRCEDANLLMRPVQIETRDTHYYHAALFAARDIEEMEELTWDYGIDFDDGTHLLKAFKCYCKSSLCRDRTSHLSQDKLRKGKLVKPSQSKRYHED